MGDLYRDSQGILQAMSGSTINRTIDEAIVLAKAEDKELFFNFNGVTVHVVGQSDAKLIYRDWHRSLCGYTDKKVGPMPTPQLSAEEIASDELLEKERDRRADVERAQYEAKQKIHRETTSSKLAKVKEMEFSDKAKWDELVASNQDGYGSGIISFANRWARLMQHEVDMHGKAVSEVASTANQEADVEGITGFMYGCAVRILSSSWKYGEELRLWHNKDAQIGDEGDGANKNGGVLNSALLSVSV